MLPAKLAAMTLSVVVFFIYLKFARRRWHAVLEYALQYHRHHLHVIRGDHGVSEKTREVAKGMLWVIEKQLPKDEMEGTVNSRGFMRSLVGRGTSLQILGDIYYRLYRYRYDLDERIPRLLATLSSVIYRLFFLNSWVRLIVVPYWDLKLLLSFLPVVKGGPMKLYRGLYGDYRQSRRGN